MYVGTCKNYETVDPPLVPFPFSPVHSQKWDIIYLFITVNSGIISLPLKQAHLTSSLLKRSFLRMMNLKTLTSLHKFHQVQVTWQLKEAAYS